VLVTFDEPLPPLGSRVASVIDSHFHLADPAFDADLADVISRAVAAGVNRGLCILTAGDPDEAERGRRLGALWPDVRFAIGVHPHVAGRYAGRADEAVTIVREAIAATPQARPSERSVSTTTTTSRRATCSGRSSVGRWRWPAS